jgi:hypothetical protein
MNLDIVETRKSLEDARSETSGGSLLKQFEENLSEMLRHRAKIMEQLNSLSST